MATGLTLLTQVECSLTAGEYVADSASGETSLECR